MVEQSLTVGLAPSGTLDGMDDIIVIGGRAAGAPTAMLLARAGFQVRVVERSPELTETLMGIVVQVAGTARLRAWGLLDAVLATGCPRIRDARAWVDGREWAPETGPDTTAATGIHPAERAGAPWGPPEAFALAPRRSALDPVLLDGARRAGATVELGNALRGLLTDRDRVTGVSTDRGDYRARLVVGADGRNSRLAQLVDAPKYIDQAPATYLYYGYWDRPISGLRLFWAASRLIFMAPTNNNQTMVAYLAPHSGFDAVRRDPMGNYLRILRSDSQVMEVIDGASMTEPLRGTGDLPTFFRQSAGPGWALAGDAGHHKDPLLGRGITDAFRDAELLADAVISGWDSDLDRAVLDYQGLRDKLARPLSSANDSVVAGLEALPTALTAQGFFWLTKLEPALDPPRIADQTASIGLA